jgi:hypothetical protein
LVPSVWLSSVRQISGLIMQRVFHEMPHVGRFL